MSKVRGGFPIKLNLYNCVCITYNKISYTIIPTHGSVAKNICYYSVQRHVITNKKIT
jgi:hypothetical protein